MTLDKIIDRELGKEPPCNCGVMGHLGDCAVTAYQRTRSACEKVANEVLAECRLIVVSEIEAHHSCRYLCDRALASRASGSGR